MQCACRDPSCDFFNVIHVTCKMLIHVVLKSLNLVHLNVFPWPMLKYFMIASKSWFVLYTAPESKRFSHNMGHTMHDAPTYDPSVRHLWCPVATACKITCHPCPLLWPCCKAHAVAKSTVKWHGSPPIGTKIDPLAPMCRFPMPIPCSLPRHLLPCRTEDTCLSCFIVLYGLYYYKRHIILLTLVC